MLNCAWISQVVREKMFHNRYKENTTMLEVLFSMFLLAEPSVSLLVKNETVREGQGHLFLAIKRTGDSSVDMAVLCITSPGKCCEREPMVIAMLRLDKSLTE